MPCPDPPPFHVRLIEAISSHQVWTKWLYDLWTWACRPNYVALTTYDAEPARTSESNVHGGLLSLVTAQPLSSGVPINVTQGVGKILIVVNAGSDISGTMTITGTSVDRETGATTGAVTNDIVVDALTTDSSSTDGNGNILHGFTGAYISSNWFNGALAISTTDLTLTDVDVYHVSFEQCNDVANYTIETFDVNIYTTDLAAASNAEFDAYLYTLQVAGNKCDIARIADLNLGTNGFTSVRNRYWRLRRGNLETAMVGTTDGLWFDAFYSNSPAYIEDATFKVWIRQ